MEMEEEGVFSGRRKENPVTQENLDLQENSAEREIQNGKSDKTVKPPGPVKKFFAGIVVSGLILAAFIAIQLIVGSVFLAVLAAQQMAQNPSVDWEYAVILAQSRIYADPILMPLLTAVATVCSAFPAVFFYWLIWGRKRTDADRRFFREKVLKGRVFLIISIAAFGLYYFAVIISAVIAMVSPHIMQQYEDMIELALGEDTIIMLVTTVIAAPVSEECIMRGLILRNLQKYFSVPVTIIIQAILFGIFHMNWVQGLYVLPVGAALGYTAVKCRSVLPCIYMHMFYNLMSVVVAVLPAFFQSVLCCVLMPVLCAGLVYYLGKRGGMQDVDSGVQG